MAKLEDIKTQEDLDALLKAEAERAAKEARAPFKDYETIKADLAAKTGKVEELNGKLKGYETEAIKTRIGYELKLPAQLHSRLTGEDEKAIRQDAEAMAKLLGLSKGAPPLGSTEPTAVDEETVAFKGLLENLKEV